jgi:TRAP-type C4-dicarboxylate transport system permease small subunit
MNRIGRVIGAASYLSGYLAGWILLGIMGLTIAEVITRYIIHQPLILSDEFGAYSLVAMSFLGLAYTWKVKGHIRITFVVRQMPASVSNWLRVATLTIALAYVSLASKVSYDFIIDAFRRNIRANSWIMTPLKWPEMVIPIGFTLLSLMLIVEIAKTIRNIRSGASTEVVTEAEAEETAV